MITLNKKKIVIIPAYNEADRISDVLARIPKSINKVIVIDDASTDNTRDAVSKFKVKLIKHDRNLGKAISLKHGFRYAMENNYDFIITLDADGEHDPSQIPTFIEKLNKNDLVIGQRKYHRSFIRKITNKWSNLWLNTILPGIEDTQCGYRAITRDLLSKLDLKTEGFEIELEMLLEAIKHDAVIDFVNIPTKPKKKTYVRFKDYISINNTFDRWIIKNNNQLKISRIKKIFLIFSANIGLLCGKFLEKFLNQK